MVRAVIMRQFGGFMAIAIDLTGQKFGRLTALAVVGKRGGKRVWLCRCDCGTESRVAVNHLRSGASQSCGCRQREHQQLVFPISRRAGQLRGGITTHPLYMTWRHMIERCTDPASKDFKYYGGRGIRVCERWMSFAEFIADVGDRPGPEFSLDRYPNNDGHYEPGNVRWATMAQQSQNKRPRERKH